MNKDERDQAIILLKQYNSNSEFFLLNLDKMHEHFHDCVKRLFINCPCHPSLTNSGFFIDEKRLYFVCMEWEETNRNAMLGLSYFLSDLEWGFKHAESHVEVLDGNREKLIVEVLGINQSDYQSLNLAKEDN